MSEPVSLEDRRLQEAARKIAREIDPEAGGFFRSKLEHAALAGMRHAKSLPHIPASGDR